MADGVSVEEIAEKNERHGLIRYVHIEEGYSIGEKRNFGSSIARGEIVMSWDDDDWCAATRIEDQINRMRKANKAVTGYTSMLFTDGARWWKFSGHKRSNLGTSLCYLKSWWAEHNFTAKMIAEDQDFVDEAFKAGEFIATDAREQMVASIHPENTSPKNVSGGSWRELKYSPGICGYVAA